MPEVPYRLGSTYSVQHRFRSIAGLHKMGRTRLSRASFEIDQPRLAPLSANYHGHLSLAFLHERDWIIGMAPLQVAPIIKTRRSRKPQLA